jgi:MFS family permease
MTTLPQPAPLSGRERLVAACGFTASLLYGFHSTLPDLPGPFTIVEIGSDRFRYQWVSGASTIGVIVGMANLPWLRSRIGLRRCFLIGLLLYALGGVASGWSVRDDCAFAIPLFITSVGDGLMITTVLSLLWIEFPGRRDWSIGLYVIGLYAGRILAPMLGGFLINEPSWRTVVIFPSALAGLVLIATYESFDSDVPADERRPSFDFPGLALLICWFICLLVGLGRFQLWGWDTSDAAMFYYVLGVLSFIAFLYRQATATCPLLTLSLLRNRRWALSVVIKAIADTVFTTVLLLIVRYMVLTREYPRTTTGIVLIPSVLAMVLVQILVARFATRDSRKRRLVIGMLGLALCTWELARIDLFTDKRWLAVVLALWSASAGLAGAPVVCITFDGLTREQVAASASIKNLMRVLPTSIGAGLLAIVINWRETAIFDLERQTIEENRPGVAGATAWIQDQIAPHSLRPNDLPEQARGVVANWVRANASVWADQSILRFFALLTFLGVGLSLMLKPLPPDAPGPLTG